VRGAAELRVKESDRIAALVAGFRNLGFQRRRTARRLRRLQTGETGTPQPAASRTHAAITVWHGVAIAALAAAAPSTIQGADAVAISYPGFFETLDRLVASRDELGAKA